MRVAAIQSNYIPWKGYFDMINAVDLFVFYDDVQYTTRDWRNRNLIKTPNGLKWLTIPVSSKRTQKICEVEIQNSYWQDKHWKSIVHNYSKAKYFKEYQSFFEEIYLQTTWKNLSQFNQFVIKKISSEILDIHTQFVDSRKYNLQYSKEERILELLKKCSATEYLSGFSAKSYLKEDFLRENGIELIWMDYSGYSEYQQLHPPFEHNVSIIDLIFNEGQNIKKYIKSFSEKL